MQALKKEAHFTWLVIKGLKAMDRRVLRLADNAWIIACTALWHAEIISNEEKQQCMSIIKAHLIDAADPQDAYDELVQRILLAREYVQKDETRYVPAPSVWFDPTNKSGFAGTKRWLNRVEERRRSFPLYAQSIKVFGEAIQDISESDAAVDFHYWITYFAERGWQKMVNLLLATVGNMRSL